MTHIRPDRNIKGILFDFDGVLADSMLDHFAAWKKAMKEFSVDITEEEYYPLEGMNVYEIAKKFCREHGLDVSCSMEIVHKKKANYIQNNTAVLYPGVEQILDALKARKVLIGIVTASLYEQLLHSVPSGFLARFDAVVSGEKTARGKPFPDPYLQGLAELKLQPEECIVVENAPLGIQAAKSAGIYCIGITSTVGRETLAEADEIVECFNGLMFSNIFKSH